MKELIPAEDYDRILDWHYDTEREEDELLMRPTCAPHYYRLVLQRQKADKDKWRRRSLTFSTGKAVERVGKSGAVKRLLTRGLLLFLVCVFYSGGISQGLAGVRWLGVLNRIALASTAAGILLVFLLLVLLADLLSRLLRRVLV